MTDNRLAPGDIAPEFTLPDADGNEVSLADYRGRKVIVYFYPAASTPGCTKQACDFRDSLDELNGAGLDVVGISPDKPAKLAKFRDNEGLTFPLLSDPEKTTLTAWGAFGEKKMYGKVVQGVIRYVPRRRGRQDRGRTVQRARHRSCRQAAPRPVRLGPPRSLPPFAEAQQEQGLGDGEVLDLRRVDALVGRVD